jgi:hypothetical protein
MENNYSEQEVRAMIAKAVIESRPRPSAKPQPKYVPPPAQAPTAAMVLKGEKRLNLPPQEVKLKVTVTEPQETETTPLQTLNGVHLKLYDYFGYDPGTVKTEDVKKMQRIHEWAFTKAGTAKQAFEKIRNLEGKVGASNSGEALLNKLHSHLVLRSL